jgi:hypothetical protein
MASEAQPPPDKPDQQASLIAQSRALLEQSRAGLEAASRSLAEVNRHLDRARNVLQAVFLRRSLRRLKDD